MLTTEELQQVYDYVLQQGRRIESLGTLPEGVPLDEISAFPAVHTGSGTTAASLLVPMERAKEWMQQQATEAANDTVEPVDRELRSIISDVNTLAQSAFNIADETRTDLAGKYEELVLSDENLEEGRANEAAARIAADEELQNAINVEATARIAADDAIRVLTKIIHNLGTYDTRDSLLNAAARISVIQLKDTIEPRILFGKYGTTNHILILQHNTRTGTTAGAGSGTTMQYVFDGKQRYTRYIEHTATAVTSVQSLQPEGVRNLYFTSKGFIGLRDMWGTQVGSGFFLPDNTAVREDAANITASAVGLVTTSFLGTTKTSTLGAVTSARAGVMTVELYNELKDATAAITNTQTTVFNKFEEVESTESNHYAEIQQHLTAIYNRLTSAETTIASLETRIAALEALHPAIADGDEAL